MAGSFPVSAIAGKAEYMKRFGTGEVNHSGTFNACVMAAAAVSASIKALRAENPYARVAAYGKRLMAGLRDIAKDAGCSAARRRSRRGIPRLLPQARRSRRS